MSSFVRSRLSVAEVGACLSNQLFWPIYIVTFVDSLFPGRAFPLFEILQPF